MIKSNYCNICGSKLEKRINKNEFNLEYNFCPKCNTFKFEKFNVACSMIVFNKDKTKVCLVKQYGHDEYILVAGYIMQGENAEVALKREIEEELGVSSNIISFNETRFFAKSNTLMMNFAVSVDESLINTNEEIDSFQFFLIEDAKKEIKENSLAKEFLIDYLNKIK